MFLQRFKYEFSENRRLLILYGLSLVAILWSHIHWWSSPANFNSGEMHELISGLSTIAICALVITISIFMFKRDDLKGPEDFWATRPIRPLPLYGAKLAFIWVVLAIPAGLTMTIMGLIAGQTATSLLGGLEIVGCLGFAGSLLALSCMNHAGAPRALSLAGTFIIGIVATITIIKLADTSARLEPFIADEPMMMRNLMIALPVLCLITVLLCIRQMRDKHCRNQGWWFATAGMLSVIFVLFGRFSKPIAEQVVVLTKVTSATLLSDHNIKGKQDAARFFQGTIQLDAVESVDAGERGFWYGEMPVKTPGFEKPWFKVHLENFEYDINKDRSRITPRPILGYRIYDQNPTNHYSESSASLDEEAEKTIAALPKRKIRINDTIMVRRNKYHEVHRARLDEGFSLNLNGVWLNHVPASSQGGLREDTITWKSFSPSFTYLITSNARPIFAFDIAHPALKKPVEANTFTNQSSSEGGTIFGRHTVTGYDFSERAFRANYHWREQTGKSGNNQTSSTDQTLYRKDAELIVKSGGKEQIQIPIDLEVEIPDPDLVQKMLQDGKL